MGRSGETLILPIFQKEPFNLKRRSMIKTYGARGMAEWVALIRVGRAAIQVPFTGGTKAGYTMTPATYKTSSPVFQQIIEDSDYFKSGKIFLMKKVVTDEDTQEVAAKTEKPKAEAAAPVSSGQEKELEKISVSDRGEAKAYLMEHFNLSAGTLRTKADIERYGKAHGVEFVGLE